MPVYENVKRIGHVYSQVYYIQDKAFSLNMYNSGCVAAYIQADVDCTHGNLDNVRWAAQISNVLMTNVPT
jgi:hypothetical protein